MRIIDSEKVWDQLVDFFESQGCKINILLEGTGYKEAEVENFQKSGDVQMKIESNPAKSVRLIWKYPHRVAKKRMGEMLMLLNYLNDEDYIGAFRLDPDSNEVQFKMELSGLRMEKDPKYLGILFDYGCKLVNDYYSYIEEVSGGCLYDEIPDDLVDVLSDNDDLEKAYDVHCYVLPKSCFEVCYG